MGILAGIASGIGSLLFGGAGALAGKLLGGKKKAVALPGPTKRDVAREEVERQDEIRRRRGASADMVTGTGGAALPGSGVGRLVAGS